MAIGGSNSWKLFRPVLEIKVLDGGHRRLGWTVRTGRPAVLGCGTFARAGLRIASGVYALSGRVLN